MSEEVFVTGLTTELDSLEPIETETNAAIEDKTKDLKFYNRAQRRLLAKKMKKQDRANMGTISKTAKKLTYINLIQQMRNLNEKEKNQNETIED